MSGVTLLFHGERVGRPRLIIVCGIPGSGKSTFALRVADRWEAVSFASETFAEALGTAARTASGDLSKEAIVHAYSAMAAAVADALSRHRLVIAVGSFRSEEQRQRFRDIATSAGASVTTLRILCPIETAAQRVRSRLASGERGPTAEAMRQIDAELNRASQPDAILINDSSVEHFHQQVDALLQALGWGAEHDASNASIMQRFQQLATGKSPLVGDMVGAKPRTETHQMIKAAPEGPTGPWD